MRVEERKLDVTTTLEGERVGMSIDQGALAHIMSVLTDLYSDPEMAVIREYSTNALDAHVEAGLDRPIEVTTPTPLAPFFRVRDYGLGLNADDIRDIYSLYGASTKRESDDVVGMLGLGCKSALTYTDQFTLTGIKDGVCTQVSVSRDEDGGGSMTIVAQHKTDEPSGVEIIVPAMKYNQFENKAVQFFRFWTPGTVLVNGKEPTRIDGFWIADDIVLTEDVDSDLVVMGNVAYPVDHSYTNGGYRGYRRWNSVAFVNIGDVHFTPSREALQMTGKTKQTIDRISERIKRESEVAIQKQIDDVTSYSEALRLYYQIASLDLVDNNKFIFRGEPIPTHFTKRDNDPQFVIVKAKKYYREKGWSKITAVATNWNVIWLVGYDGHDFSPHKRKKLERWMEEKGLTDFDGQFVLTARLPKTPWLDKKDKVFKWEEVAAQKIVREVKRGDGRPSGSYEGYIGRPDYHRVIQAADIDTAKPLFFITKDQSYHNLRSFVLDHHADATLVILGRNRINKFQRDFPTAQNAVEWCRETAAKWFKKLSQKDKLALAVHEHGDRRTLALFEADRINDPDLREAVRIANSKPTKLIEKFELYGSWVAYQHMEWKNPLDQYALLTDLSYYRYNKGTMDHVYIYVNAVYSQSQSEVARV